MDYRLRLVRYSPTVQDFTERNSEGMEKREESRKEPRRGLEDTKESSISSMRDVV